MRVSSLDLPWPSDDVRDSQGFSEPTLTYDEFKALQPGSEVVGMRGDIGEVLTVSDGPRGFKSVTLRWGKNGAVTFTFTSNQTDWMHWTAYADREVYHNPGMPE